MTRLLTAASAAALMLACSAGVASAQNFRALAEQDLTAAHAALRDNHPAAVVPGAGDTFASWLDAGLAEGRSRLDEITNADGYVFALRGYANGFRDNNISIEPTYEPAPAWSAAGTPNFTTAWRDGGYVVSWVKPGVRNLPPLGARLVECDTVSAADMATRRLDKFEGDLTLEAERVRTAPYLLWDRNNPFTGDLPRQCKFQDGRRQRTFTLTTAFTPPAELEAAYRASVFTPSVQPLGIETVNGRPWVRMNSLSESAPWDAFQAQVEAQAAALRGPSGFVLDLRGAEGSSLNATARGYGTANRIWSPEFTVSRQPEAGQLTYRVTPANRQWYADTLGRMQADPNFVAQYPAIIAETQEIVTGFDAAITANQPTFALAGRASVADAGVANPVQGPVIVLVDGGCSGGCLDLVDLLIKLPNVRLAGTQTDAASIFIEPTVLRLPSNYGQLSYGHKAWTTRARGNNQPHTPTLLYTGNRTDEAAVRAWVASQFGA